VTLLPVSLCPAFIKAHVHARAWYIARLS